VPQTFTSWICEEVAFRPTTSQFVEIVVHRVKEYSV
jgi:hypothetical protein